MTGFRYSHSNKLALLKTTAKDRFRSSLPHSCILKSLDLAVNVPFEIDLQTGSLNFPQVPLNVAPKQSVNVILATNPGVCLESDRVHGGWQRYRLRHDLADGQILGISLFFHDARLRQVRFDYRPANESDWSSWSKEKELARTATFRQEIIRQLGKRGRFPWGLADAGYDDKSASAVLFITYG